MIYRTDGERGKVYQPLDWQVYSVDHHRIRLGSEDKLREHLKAHPDEDFWLIPRPYLNREIDGEDDARFDQNHEYIRCGIVRYDSVAQRILTRDDMRVQYGEKVKQWLPLLQQATMRLAEVLGRSASWVMASWDCEEGPRGQPVFTLRISDWTGEVSASFTPEELRAYSQDHYPWRRLWGDLLEVRSHRQLAAVAEVTAEGD